METSASMTEGRTTRWLLSCGLVAGPLFTLAYLVEGAARGDSYNALRHPVSSLALGKRGWTQVANFLITGGMVVAFGIGASRVHGVSRWLPRLIEAIGVGLIGAGVCVTDPIGGYPQGTPALPRQRSKFGVLHRLFSSFVFLGMPTAFIIEARRGPRVWAAYSGATCAAFLGSFIASSAGFAQSAGLSGVGGLFQRLALCTGFAWVTVCAARLLRGMTEA